MVAKGITLFKFYKKLDFLQLYKKSFSDFFSFLPEMLKYMLMVYVPVSSLCFFVSGKQNDMLSYSIGKGYLTFLVAYFAYKMVKGRERSCKNIFTKAFNKRFLIALLGSFLFVVVFYSGFFFIAFPCLLFLRTVMAVSIANAFSLMGVCLGVLVTGLSILTVYLYTVFYLYVVCLIIYVNYSPFDALKCVFSLATPFYVRVFFAGLLNLVCVFSILVGFSYLENYISAFAGHKEVIGTLLNFAAFAFLLPFFSFFYIHLFRKLERV